MGKFIFCHTYCKKHIYSPTKAPFLYRHRQKLIENCGATWRIPQTPPVNRPLLIFYNIFVIIIIENERKSKNEEKEDIVMANTVPNQKTVIIHKKRPQSNFLQLSNEHWMEFNKKYGPYALQVYLYLTQNADGFNLALSQAAAENEAGIKRTTFHKYIDLLIREGYLVERNGNTYDFYETPHKQEHKETEVPPHSKKTCAWNEQENSHNGFGSSPDDSDLPPSNKEIDKKYKDNIDTAKDIGKQEEERGEKTGETRKTVQEFIF